MRPDGSSLWHSLKCLDTPCFVKPVLILFMCSLILTNKGLVVLPTYCLWQGHSRTYVTCVLVHVINSFILYSFPVVRDLKATFFHSVFLLFLQGRHFPHLKNPFRSLEILICLGGSSALCTNLFLRAGALL